MHSKKTALTNKASACFNAPILALFMPPLPSPALHATLLPVCSHLLSAGSGSSAPSAGYSAPHTCEQGDSMGIPGITGLGAKGSDRKGGIPKHRSSLLNSWQAPDNFAGCAALRGSSQRVGRAVPGTAEILSAGIRASPLWKHLMFQEFWYLGISWTSQRAPHPIQFLHLTKKPAKIKQLPEAGQACSQTEWEILFPFYTFRFTVKQSFGGKPCKEGVRRIPCF